MAAVHGKDGSVTFATGHTDNVHEWSLDRELETADIMPLGAENRIALAGPKNATGQYSCYVDDTSPQHDVGDAGSATFTMTTGRTFTADILITGVSVSVNTSGAQVATYKWALSGDGTSSDFAVA